jgi:hypothetical protein
MERKPSLLILKQIQIFLLCLVGSCTSIDQFADRIVDFNVETEKARTRVLMLNILRSAYRKPLQFTDVSSITGQATISGSISAILPMQGKLGAGQLDPMATISAGPTFNVAPLTNKEFFSGLLGPISGQTIVSYMMQGRRLNVLYSLMVSHIIITIDGKRTVLTSNGFGGNFSRFEDFCNELYDAGFLAQGVYVEQGSMTPMDSLAGIQGANMELATAANGSKNFVARLKSPEAIMCFDEPRTTIRPPGEFRPMIERLRQAMSCKNLPEGRIPEANPVRRSATLELIPRSTMGVIYRLGEIARLSLGISTESCSSVADLEDCHIPQLHRYRRKDGGAVDVASPFFQMTFDSIDPSMTVKYEGRTYGIKADPHGYDHSSEILELTEELLALSSSARDLPSPAVITIH